MLDKLFSVLNSLLLISSLVSFNMFAQLKSPNNQADYIVVTAAQFETALQPFVEWRQQKGFTVKVADIQNVYTEFPDSGAQFSIRDFISYALTYWQNPKPKYVLLVGGINFIPSYYVASSFASDTSLHEDSVAIDEWYAVNSIESSYKPEVEIGRFPVNNSKELQNIIAKTIYFEDSLSRKSYPEDFLFLTDKTDSSSFTYEVNQFISSTLPANYSKETIFAGNDPSIEITRTHLFESLNKGTLFFSYYGHGAYQRLSRYNLFTYNDVDSLKENNLPFIFSSVACSQNFDVPEDSSLIVKLLTLPKGGAAATVASSGLDYLTSGSEFLKYFYNAVFENPGTRIGDALLSAKSSLEFPSITSDAVARRYTLLGDPALKMPADAVASVGNGYNQIPNGFVLEQNYPNPFNPSTQIQYQVSKPGLVSIKVYDLLGKEITTLVNSEKKEGDYTVTFDASGLASGIYFYRMQVTSDAGNNIFTSTKKLIVLK